MTDAPERIWLDETSLDDDGFYYVEAEKRHANMDQEYVRADLATPSAPVVTREQIAQVIASNRAVDYDTLFPSDFDLADDILAALQPSETAAQAHDAALVEAKRVALDHRPDRPLQSRATAEAMPTTQDALTMIVDASQRLRDLGWVRGGGFGVKGGDECAICEFGSTGIWSGRLDNDEEFFLYGLYGGYVSARHKVWAKPLSALTDDEHKIMQECDCQSAEYMEGEFARWSEDDEQ